MHHFTSDNIKVSTCVAVIFFALFLISFSYAHDAQKPELNKWFDGLKNGKNLACCSDADGTALIDGDWESRNGKYRVQIKGQWYEVPDEAVLPGPNMDGRTIVWPLYHLGNITIRCFIPGMMT